MAVFVLHLLKAAWHARVNHFLGLFTVMLELSAILVVWSVGREDDAASARNAAVEKSEGKTHFSISALITLLLVASTWLGYFVVAWKWEAFADYDEAFFTLQTLKGINFPPPIWPQISRFFPLGDQEFNVLRHFTNTAFGYHGVPLGQLLIVCCVLIFLDRGISLAARAGLTTIYMLLPGTVISFGGLVYQERSVVFWLACMLFCLRRFEMRGYTSWAVAAAVCAQCMLYYKETAFLLLLGFSVGRLILRCLPSKEADWDLTRLRSRESRLDYCYILFALIFVFYYESIMIHHAKLAYVDLVGVSQKDTILYYLRFDFLALLFVATALIRAFMILRRKISASPFWDGLALGGVLCYAAYIALRLCRPNYLTPVDFIAVLYLGRLLLHSWKTMPAWKKAAAAAVALVIVAQGFSLSMFQVYERENTLQAKVKLADTIVAITQNDPNHVHRLYFPFAPPYTLTEFASYLTYRGLSMDGYTQDTSSTPSGKVALVSRGFTNDAPCVDYRRFVCYAGASPSKSDLVIEMPDDHESVAAMSSYRAGGDPLLVYEPQPPLQPWMAPALNYLRVGSFGWQFKTLPDRWLHASITDWK